MQTQNTFSWINSLFPDLSSIQPLGQGGQKLVFSATHPTEGDVVLKIIHPFQDPEGVRREILAVQQIASSRVPKILAVGRVDTPMGSCIWIREQRIMGITLRERLQNGPLPIDELLKFGIQMLESLSAAEDEHIVHRDVKPENIIVDHLGNYWLIDFGIARNLSMSPLTPLTLPFGKFTLGYAPLEQIRNVQSEIDARADLFAFGVTFFECATGVQPFIDGAASQFEILRRLENNLIPPLHLGCEAANSLTDLVSSLTQRRRDHRPSNVGDALVWMKDILKAQTKA